MAREKYFYMFKHLFCSVAFLIIRTGKLHASCLCFLNTRHSSTRDVLHALSLLFLFGKKKCNSKIQNSKILCHNYQTSRERCSLCVLVQSQKVGWPANEVGILMNSSSVILRLGTLFFFFFFLGNVWALFDY